MRLDLFPSHRALAGGLPPGLGLSLAVQRLRPWRWTAGGVLVVAAALGTGIVGLEGSERRDVTVGEVGFEAPKAATAAGLAVETVAAATAAVPASLPVLPAALPGPAAPAVERGDAPAVEALARTVSVLPIVGSASYYAAKFEGRLTANGERYRGSELTAAHRTLPFGTKVRVTNPRNGRSVVVRINDRGPFHPRRVLDVSRTAAVELGILRRGHGQVELEVLGR
jgi:rare lipoprotein A